MARTRITHEVDDAIIDENTKGRPEIALFAKTLNRLLAEKNVHQDDLAQALGISTGSVSNYRNGKKAPGFTMIVKIADYLGVDCNYLMTGVKADNYMAATELGLSEAAIRQLKKILLSPVFKKELNDFVGSDCFRQMIAYFFNFRGRMSEIVMLSENPAAEYSDIQEEFSNSDLLEYYASKNLSRYFDRIKEQELSKSSTLVKESDGYKLELEFVKKQ